tara:strand:+ start:475 stop:2217 length:1743 start_codon:yes stop_codon:yes gene_type:complete
MSNRGFERSMNGINDIEVNEVQFPDGSTISSASNLVQLDTNNNFTAFNTFDVNLPTSTKTPDSANQFTTKTYVDNLPDANNYPTAFERDGTTGIVKLSVNDTGTPLSGDTIYTSITDAQISQISQIATNTNDITNLTTATNECFDDVAISGNDLTFSRVDNANPKTIVIPTTDTTDFVDKTNDQTIGGVKTFNEPPECSTTPTTSNQLANKSYVDTQAGTPANMMTTDTAQTITDVKTFNTLPESTITPTNSNQLTRRGYVDDRLTTKLNNGGSLIQIDSNGKISGVDAVIGDNGVLNLFNRASNTGGSGTSNNKGGINIDINGNVGVNCFQSQSAPLRASLVVDKANTSQGATNYGSLRFIKYNGGNQVNGGFSENTGGMAIYGNGRGVFTDAIVSHNGSFSASDERIKENIRDFTINEATEKLKLVRPRQYEFIDKVSRGDKTEYGFVAQELEQHYPHCINKDTYKIPNIMKTYDVSGTTIYDISDVNINDTLKIIDKKGRDNLVNVIDVSSSYTSGAVRPKVFITIDKPIEDDKCFVYGNEVDDFRIVDKEPIFTLTTASVIELIKRVETLEKKLNM